PRRLKSSQQSQTVVTPPINPFFIQSPSPLTISDKNFIKLFASLHLRPEEKGGWSLNVVMHTASLSIQRIEKEAGMNRRGHPKGEYSSQVDIPRRRRGVSREETLQLRGSRLTAFCLAKQLKTSSHIHSGEAGSEERICQWQ
ncbi:hypothetical protein BaRGS_00018686, partial [Batillaria attramentaria]